VSWTPAGPHGTPWGPMDPSTGCVWNVVLASGPGRSSSSSGSPDLSTTQRGGWWLTVPRRDTGRVPLVLTGAASCPSPVCPGWPWGQAQPTLPASQVHSLSGSRVWPVLPVALLQFPESSAGLHGGGRNKLVVEVS
jgi:hypothetical protein